MCWKISIRYTDPHLSWSQNLINAVNIRQGGLTYYGGFLMATLTLILYALWKKVPLRLGMDIIAPCVMIGLGFGRIGCYLNGCCYGSECEVPWAVQFPYGSDAYLTEFQQNLLKQPVPRQMVYDNSSLADYMDSKGLKYIQEPLPVEVLKDKEWFSGLKSKEEVLRKGRRFGQLPPDFMPIRCIRQRFTARSWHSPSPDFCSRI